MMPRRSIFALLLLLALVTVAELTPKPRSSMPDRLHQPSDPRFITSTSRATSTATSFSAALPRWSCWKPRSWSTETFLLSGSARP